MFTAEEMALVFEAFNEVHGAGGFGESSFVTGVRNKLEVELAMAEARDRVLREQERQGEVGSGAGLHRLTGIRNSEYLDALGEFLGD